MTIKAIETRYAGCRFRSRLEARWAVFFDALGIEWEYESQGYWVSPGWGDPPDEKYRIKYLPDFWLPELRLWVEVKGELTASDAEHLCWATCPHDGLPASPQGEAVSDASRCGKRLLLLGSHPRVERTTTTWQHPTHAVLAFHKGAVSEHRIVFTYWPHSRGGAHDSGLQEREIWGDHYGLEFKEEALIGDRRLATYWNHNWLDLLTPRPIQTTYDENVYQAYRAARSARFEHGERG